MAKWTAVGFDGLICEYQELLTASVDDIGCSVYEGAKIVADEIRKATEQLPVQNGYGTPSRKKTGITSTQKAGLKEGLGISHMVELELDRNVKVGFAGYNRAKTTKGGRQANVLVARSLEVGTTWLKKNPFVTNAVKKCRSRAERAMSEEFDKRVREKLKG